MANEEHELHSWKMLSLYVFLDMFLLVRPISLLKNTVQGVTVNSTNVKDLDTYRKDGTTSCLPWKELERVLHQNIEQHREFPSNFIGTLLTAAPEYNRIQSLNYQIILKYAEMTEDKRRDMRA